MEKVTLEQVNRNVLSLKREVDELKELLLESHLELTDDVKIAIDESRKKPLSTFRSQQEIEERFL